MVARPPRIDAHQHVWSLEHVAYPWLTAEAGPLYRSFLQEEAEPLLDGSGLDGTVLVQAANSDEETQYLVHTAARFPRVRGVVGWLPLVSPDRVATRLLEWETEPVLVGVRHIVGEEDDPSWLLSTPVVESLTAVAEAGLVLDVPAEECGHLLCVLSLAERLPRLPIVIDHLGKPPADGSSREEWDAVMRAVAEHPNVHVKVSGLGTLDWEPGRRADGVRALVTWAIACFGPDRIMWGSDWPVCTLQTGHAEALWEIAAGLVDLSAADRDRVMGGTAARLYGLPEAR